MFSENPLAGVVLIVRGEFVEKHPFRMLSMCEREEEIRTGEETEVSTRRFLSSPLVSVCKEVARVIVDRG